MAISRETLAWSIVAAVLVVFGVPWFLWGSDRVVAGLPVWIWWHVAWLLLTTAVFYVFTRRAWGVGVHPRGGGDG